MKIKRKPGLNGLALVFLLAALTSCATHSLTPRQEADLESWQNDRQYDPVTGKYYHRGTPRPVQDVLHDQFIQETIND